MKTVNTRKLNTKIKKYMLTGTLLSAVLFLSGCMRFDQETGDPQGFLSEIVFNYLIIPLGQLLNFLGEFLGSYGLAIIVFTLLFRLILLPLTLRQQKGTIESQIKMSAVQPVTQEIQAELKATDDPAEQQALNMEMMEIYRENDINIGGQLSSGCLPLLLQMPIFVAMFQVLRRSNEIANASFLGIGLGEKSIILGVITGIIYLLQSRMMIKSMPEEQQGTAGTTMYITPVMMFMFAVSGPAGIGLYWLVSGVFTIGQQMFNQYYYKPKIEATVREKMGPVQKVERKRKARRNVTPTEEIDSSPSIQKQNKNRNRNRNAGKQQRNRK